MLAKHLKDGLVAVEESLSNIVNSDVTTLHDAGHHIIGSGGKRMRPQIVLLSYLAAGGTDVKLAAPLAAAIELVHTATLVHDDINDHSLTRRGEVTVHARWGRTFALLTGDYLFAKVYELMAPYGTDYNIIMANACVQLVEGETLQAAAAKAGDMSRDTYKTIIARKTASLFEAGARMGTMLAGGNEDMINALREYGYNLGMAFQIVDDILDIVGDPETMGKPVGSDLERGMGVMATQNGHTAVAEAPALVEEVDPLQQMMSRLRESGAVEIAQIQAQEMADRAYNALEALPDSPSRYALYDLVDRVMNRQN